MSAARLRTQGSVAVAKASLKRANKLQVLDPKPSDLTMVRVKAW